MSETIRKKIAFKADLDALLELLKSEKDSMIGQRAKELIDQLTGKIKPKYLIKEVKLDKIGEDHVLVNGQRLSSRVLAKQLEGAKSIYIFLASCGREIADYHKSIEDPLDHYIIDQMAYLGYLRAVELLEEELTNTYGIKKYNSLAPGSTPDWSIEEVNTIFALTDGGREEIGLSVLESGMIDPVKSLSGLIIETDKAFNSCQICQRLNCPTRKNDFDQEDYKEMMN